MSFQIYHNELMIQHFFFVRILASSYLLYRRLQMCLMKPSYFVNIIFFLFLYKRFAMLLQYSFTVTFIFLFPSFD
jgi:hypothetical protein